jgi:hypothetical protein
VDLFGEQAVQVITALLQAVCLLLVATMVMLSVRSTSAWPRPVGAIATAQIALRPVDGIDRPAEQDLQQQLPARAPPDPADDHDLLAGMFFRE